ncbi:MAG: hypothetical protein WC955_09890 [Elusimicrobiota bacterium]
MDEKEIREITDKYQTKDIAYFVVATGTDNSDVAYSYAHEINNEHLRERAVKIIEEKFIK